MVKSTESTIKCLNCATELSHTVVFCPNCGKKQINSTKKKKSNPLAIPLISILFAIGSTFAVMAVVTFMLIPKYIDTPPNFIDTQNKAKASKFPKILSQMYTAQKAYHAETRTFATSEELQSAGLSIQSSVNFEYTVENVTDSTFLAIATVKVAFGDAQVGDRASIDQNGVKSASPSLQKYAPK